MGDFTASPAALGELREVVPGVLRWLGRHPDWQPGAEPGSPGDWAPEVGSVAYAAPDAFLLVDPLLPDPPGAFLAELDRRVIAHRRPVHVLTTLRFHRRSRDELV